MNTAALARKYLETYPQHDRATLESLIAFEFTFTSPQDNHVDRETYFAKCWPLNAKTESIEFKSIFAEGDRAFVTYVQQNTEGKRFQNTEFLEFENGKLKAVEVYFGFDLAQSAKHSEKLSAVAQTNAVAVVAVKDLEKARRFYAETLGLEQSGGGDAEVLVFKSGDSLLNVYHSEYAGSNKATAVTWAVDGDVQDVVRALKARGVQFEHYDMPQTRIEGDVHVMQKIQTAWFKDPDGNILNIINRSA